jgi:formamidopyrimidine-DNA glycosylase
MPELPEVEHLRRSLEPWIVGAQLIDVRVLRKSVVTLASETGRSNAVLRAALGVGETIVGTDRRGKQMAIAFANGRFLVIQLGMTGSVTIERGAPPRGAAFPGRAPRAGKRKRAMAERG